MRASTTSLSRVFDTIAVEKTTGCTAAGAPGEDLFEIVDLAPDAAAELPTPHYPFAPSTTTSATLNSYCHIARRATVVSKLHKRSSCKDRSEDISPKVAQPAGTAFLLSPNWEKQHNRLEICLLHGIKKSIFSCFDFHICGPAVSRLRDGNYTKHLGSKSHCRTLFALKPWSCDQCGGSCRPFKKILEAI